MHSATNKPEENENAFFFLLAITPSLKDGCFRESSSCAESLWKLKTSDNLPKDEPKEVEI